MNKINELELEKVKGGGIGVGLGICIGVGALITFIVGIVDGYVNPSKCEESNSKTA